MTTFFSVVMQSTMKPYPGAAEHRPAKLRRAIDSVLQQTFNRLELIIVADDCRETFDIASEYKDERIRVIMGEARKATKWNSVCRNTGKAQARGRYVVYLDNDDFFLKGYLKGLHREIEQDYADWYIANHLEYRSGKWVERHISLTANSAGTANIIHAAGLSAQWPAECHYGSEDWNFIRRVMSLGLSHRNLLTAGYCIAHKRGNYDI